MCAKELAGGVDTRDNFRHPSQVQRLHYLRFTMHDTEVPARDPTAPRILWDDPLKVPVKEKVNDYDAFYNEIEPILLGLSFCGKLPYSRTKQRECESNYVSWHFAYWMIHFTVLTVIGLEQLFGSWHTLTKKDVDFSTTTEHGFIFAVILLLHFTTPICVFYERKAVVKLINSWPPLLEQLENTLGEKFTASYPTLIKILVCLNPFVVVAIVLLEANILLRGKYYRLLMYVSVFQASQYLLTFWFFSCHEMKSIAKKIQHAIEKISSGGPFTLYGGHNLEDLRILWLRLSVVVQNTGQAFSISIITLAACLVTVFIISWFSVISSFIHPQYRNRLDYLSVGIVTGFMVFMLCEPAHRVSEAVGENIIRALSFIELTHLPPRFRKQIETFTNTISLNYPTVSLNGLISVNREWLPSVAASVVTYLIVLVQFQASARP